MFLGCNGPLAFALNFRPNGFVENGPSQPAQIKREIMESAEIVIRRIPVLVADRQKVFGFGFYKGFVSDAVESLAPEFSPSSGLSCGDAVLPHFLHNRLPCACDQLGIVGGEVSSTKGKVHGRLLVGFVHREEETFGFGSFLGFEASTFGSSVFLPVERATLASKASVFSLHVHRWKRDCTRQRMTVTEEWASCGRLRANC